MTTLQQQMFAAALVCAATATPPLSAGLTTGSATGTGVDAHLELVIDVVELDVGPIPTVGGESSTPFMENNSVLSVTGSANANIGGLGSVSVLDLSTGVIDVSASSNVDGGSGSRTASGSAVVNGTQFGVNEVSGPLSVSSIIALDATVIQSSAMATGSPGTLTTMGSSQLAGVYGVSGNQALLTVLGTQFALAAAPAASTTPYLTLNAGNVAGLSGSIDVYLNEQIVTGDGSTNAGVLVNALRLSFNDVSVALGAGPPGLLNGDVIIAQSSAMLATPEPGALGMCGLFLGAARVVRRRRSSNKT